ncbi:MULTISPECIES: FAD-dependent monooxygenase [Microbacteriaceae]|uniref:FAD-dependent monooxygenase n=1 Tax=Microbacteriaceae TaxID=85023 RepID=UPI001E5A7985|nr:MULTISPECIES: FAD-dependent monooxygenase [Microbacteriaceae]
MRVAVVGAGIGGLAVAVGLQHSGHDVAVFERRTRPNAVGSGLTLFENTFAALEVLGLANAVRDISSGQIASMRTGQRRPSGAWLMTVPPGAVASLRSVHRMDLHRALTDQLRAGSLRTGIDAHASADGAPEVTIDNRKEFFDLVVVADGIRSDNRVRLGLDTGVLYAGYTTWRGVTTGPVDLQGEAGETWGRGKLFGIVPLPDHRIYWFGTLNTPEATAFTDEYETAKKTYVDWHSPVQECIAATPPAEVIRHDIYDLARPLPSFTRGRTVLLGDAAHAMTPNLGQGAGQAIEDAAILTRLLRGVSARDVLAALSRYNALRMKRTQTISRRSRATGRIAQASRPLTVALRDTALRLTPGTVMGAVSRSIQRWDVQ